MYTNGAGSIRDREQGENLSGLMAQVNQAQRAGDWPRAVALLQAATGQPHPPETAAQIWNSLGYSYAMDNRLFEAEMALQRGLRLAPKNLDLLSNLADLYLRREDYVQATDYLKQALQVDPNDVGVLLTFGDCAIQLGDFEAALLAFERVQSLAPETEGLDEIIRQLGGAEPDSLESAEVSLLKQLELEPDRPELLNSLAALYFQQEQFDQATDYVNRVLRRDLDNLDALQLLGNCAIQLETFDVALLAFRRVQALAPETEGIEPLLAELAAIVSAGGQLSEVAPAGSGNSHSNGHSNGSVYPLASPVDNGAINLDLTPRPTEVASPSKKWDWDVPPNLAAKPTSRDCTIIIPASHDSGSLLRCLTPVRQHAPANSKLALQVVNPPPELSPVIWGFEALTATQPPTALKTALEAAGTPYVLLLSPAVQVTAGWLDQLIAVAESDAAIAAVGPVANTAPGIQQTRADYRDVGAGLADFARRRADMYGGQWQPVSDLGSFCLLFRTHAVQVAGGLASDRPLEKGLLDLFDRLQRFGFKLACAQGIYVHHQTLNEVRPTGPNTPDEALARIQAVLAPGQAALEQNDFEGAIREFEAVTRRHPNLAAGHTALGSTLVALDQVGAALPSLRRAVELVPHLAAAHNQLGVALYRLGHYYEAEVAFLQGRQADPQDIESLLNLAELYREQQRYPDALAVIEQILLQEPQQPGAIATFGLISLAVGNRQQAEQALANLEEAPPDHPGVQAFRQAMGQPPAPTDNRHNGTLTQQSSAQPEKVSPEAIKEQMELAMAIGEAAIKLGNFELAVREFKRVIDKHPDLAAAHAALGGTLLALNRAEEAIAPLQRAVALVPEVAANHNRLGAALFRTGRPAEAEAAFNRARDLASGEIEPLLNLVDLYRSQHRYQEAVAATKVALSLDEKHPDVLVAFGILCYELGDHEGAQQAWAQLETAPPDHPGVKALGQLLDRVQVSA